jgi:hypothetical protein
MAYDLASCNLQVPRRRPGGIAADNEECAGIDRLKEDESRRRSSFSTGRGGSFDIQGVWLDTGRPGESNE